MKTDVVIPFYLSSERNWCQATKMNGARIARAVDHLTQWTPSSFAATASSASIARIRANVRRSEVWAEEIFHRSNKASCSGDNKASLRRASANASTSRSSRPSISRVISCAYDSGVATDLLRLMSRRQGKIPLPALWSVWLCCRRRIGLRHYSAK